MALFFRYLKELFLESTQKVFLLFEIIGIVIFFQPDYSDVLSENRALIQLIGGLVFLLSFLLANYAIYRNLKSLNSELQKLIKDKDAEKVEFSSRLKSEIQRNLERLRNIWQKVAAERRAHQKAGHQGEVLYKALAEIYIISPMSEFEFLVWNTIKSEQVDIGLDENTIKRIEQLKSQLEIISAIRSKLEEYNRDQPATNLFGRYSLKAVELWQDMEKLVPKVLEDGNPLD
jgi:hypothetical protein